MREIPGLTRLRVEDSSSPDGEAEFHISGSPEAVEACLQQIRACLDEPRRPAEAARARPRRPAEPASLYPARGGSGGDARGDPDYDRSGALLRKGGGKADPSRGTDNDRGGRAAPSSGPSRKGGGKADSSWDADYDRGGRAVPSSRGSDRPRGGDAGEPPPSALGLGDRLAWDRRGAAAPGASWGAGGARGNGWSGAGQWGEAGGWESWRSGGWWGGGAGWWESPGGEQRGDRAAGGGAAEAPRRWRPGAGAGQRGTPSQRHQ
ncbi:unnamed protein product [Prorocentrum cordatum]|nr:unnamed protein product [Polarella glacialis]